MTRNKSTEKSRKQAVTVPRTVIPKRWLAMASLVLALVATLIVYLPSFSFDYVNNDDPAYVHGNQVIHSLTAGNIKKMFTEQAAVNYHPLTLLSLAIDYARADNVKESGEKDPAPFHQTNILLHLLNVILVFVFIYRLSGNKWTVAFLCAVLFGIHPVHVESVSWISERKDVLYTFFFLLSLLTYLSYTASGNIFLYMGALLLFILSALSKPAAAPMGLILF
ncbi:MAG: hypothetical protein ACOYM0_16200, partial [Bacteroidales bacterium]